MQSPFTSFSPPYSSLEGCGGPLGCRSKRGPVTHFLSDLVLAPAFCGLFFSIYKIKCLDEGGELSGHQQALSRSCLVPESMDRYRASVRPFLDRRF